MLGELVKSPPHDGFKLHSPYITSLDALGKILIKHNPLNISLLERLLKTDSNDPDLRFKSFIMPISFKPRFLSNSFWNMITIAGDPYEPSFSLVKEGVEIGYGTQFIVYNYAN